MDHSTNSEVICTKSQVEGDGRAIDPMTHLTPRGPQRRTGQERRVRNIEGTAERRNGDRRRENDPRATASWRWAEKVQVDVFTGFLRVFAGPIRVATSLPRQPDEFSGNHQLMG